MSIAVLLAVDDRPDNLFVLEQLAGAYLPDIKMLTAKSAAEGLALAEAEAIDGALIDVQMPGMNGIEMCRRLKTDPKTAPIHVILVTAHQATSALKAQGLDAGADDFIAKPIDNIELAAKVKVMLRLKAAEDCLRQERDHLEEAVQERTQKLQEAESRYRTLFQTAADAILITDFEGHLLEVNNEACRCLGYNRDALLLMTVGDISGAEYMARRPEIIAQLRDQGHILFETGLVARDGRQILTECSCSLIEFRGQSAVLCIARDITERRQSEEALRSAAQRWRRTFDAIGDAVCLVDRDLKITQCNQAMLDLAGKPFAEIIGRTCREALPKVSSDAKECACLRMSKSRQREVRLLPLNDRWYHATAHPILSEAGALAGGVYIIADVTDYQLAAKRIKDLNILLKTVKEINEALLRVQSEPELFQQTCDLVLNVPYVRFVWIGLVDPGRRDLNIVAHAGHEAGYLATIKVSYDETEYGRGPSGEAIRTRRPVVIEDMEHDPRIAPWREEALKRGYRSNIALPLVCQEEMVGVLKVYSGKPGVFGRDEIEFLDQVAGDIAVGIKSIRLEQEVIQSLIKFQVIMIQTVEAIASMAEMRDPYTAGHQRRVTQLACALAEELDLDANRIEGLRVAGLLHDIGKIVVPAEILNKPGKLNSYELNIIRTHPQAGYDILRKIDFPWPVAQITLQHHERLDGSGYPQGLTKNDILLESRILAVADVVEAMAAHRPYRPALGPEIALQEIAQKKGILYDPEVVDACIALFSRHDFEFSREKAELDG